MRRRNNLYLMLLIFIMLTLAIIFCASILVIWDQSETMEQQQELEAVRIHEAQESTIELATFIYAEPNAYENPLANEENVKKVVLNHYEEAHTDAKDEPSYDDRAGLEC